MRFIAIRLGGVTGTIRVSLASSSLEDSSALFQGLIGRMPVVGGPKLYFQEDPESREELVNESKLFQT